MKYKFHIPTQQYGFLELETENPTGKDLKKMESIYNRYAETSMNFNKGKFKEYKTFTGETILYNKLTHKYTDTDGNLLLSASQYAKSIKPIFNKEMIIPAVAKKYKVDGAIIDKMWTANGNISLTFGNAIHYAMEQWFKYKKHSCGEKEYNLPKHPFLREVVTSFPDKDKNILSEVIISDVKNKMVGRADLLKKLKSLALIVADYKSDAKIKDNLKFHFQQLSFYATMLINHGYKVDSLVVWNYVEKWVKYKSEVLTIKI